MHYIKVNDSFDFEADKEGSTLLINGNKIDADISQISSSSWHIIHNFKSFNIEIVSFNPAKKTAEIKVDNNIYSIMVKDQFDLLLEKSGLGKLNTLRVADLKAPMPGMVLKTFVSLEVEVKKGDNLFILEAMKMENIIKAATDGVIKSINIKSGDKVEKGEVLIQFV